VLSDCLTTIRLHLQRAQCIAPTATRMRFLLHLPFLCVHLLSLNSLFPFNAFFFPPLVPLSSFRYPVSDPMFCLPFFFLSFFLFFLSFFAESVFPLVTKCKTSVYHISSFCTYSKHVLDQLTATEFSYGEKSEAADMTEGISAAWLQTPNTMMWDVQRSCQCENRLHGPTAPCKFTVPTVNTTDNFTSRYLMTIHTHILLAMLVAARSKECTVYCFMAGESCVRIPLGKWLYICFFVRSCRPGHKLMPLSELQQYQ